MTATPEPLKPLKTWSHLADRRKRPSEYDIVSTRLHYRRRNPDVPWELDPDLPMNDWYRKYCNESPLKHPDWDLFQDPDQLVYRTYNILQDGQEAYVGGLFDQFSDRGHDEMIPNEWIETLTAFYTPARYLYHGLQMGSAYVAQMAPASTITTCLYLQSADSLRWVTHTCYRTVELSKARPDLGFGKNERAHWEDDPQWQGFRRLLEEGLVVWDWAESFVVFNLVLKPAVEEALLGTLADVARSNNDTLYSLLSQAQMRDAERHRRWASRLVEMALAVDGNREWLRGRVAAWTPKAEEAIRAYCGALKESDGGEAAIENMLAFQRGLGLRD
ncbi:aromatic/alkene monooxygenase hydroxylase subunit beta [Zavarzinia compransoris]|uniref:aromatic/alkene monooxygenase hydroxylase subunit beta n=1 Tax=Zavarzinia marina TaxID=2911065 RepID=UPI001F492358|nr:aromatic/alkene monooxygenase hydroxylase subunit beta [Zavarzinia marina]MCF4167009.1 aromatic/alkene monooxygenase hydroxylase subunit beta [Zavarzinia marina]